MTPSFFTISALLAAIVAAALGWTGVAALLFGRREKGLQGGLPLDNAEVTSKLRQRGAIDLRNILTRP